ncbi:MAG: hypothetical protein D6767_03805 [Candidatus Hydrogenedentota bacterium]|nr:MAG: hypothetical protein D6767_03805 [Candidatus Hydrogenedentota bacterium]
MFYHYWPWYIGGLAIAAVSIILVLFTGKFLSVTRGYVSACSIITKKPYFHRPDIGGPFGYRTFFVLGILLGGFLAALYSGSYHPNFSLGQFDKIWGDSIWIKAVVLFIGGVCWGYGSRMARGCTSGNSISGLAKGSPASLVVTLCFLLAGAAVTYLINYIGGTL